MSFLLSLYVLHFDLFSRFLKKQTKFQNIVNSYNSFKNDCVKIFSKRQCNVLKVRIIYFSLSNIRNVYK